MTATRPDSLAPRFAPGDRGASHPASLAAATRLLAALDAAGVRYCHWKSNQHLEAGLAGSTDLDLLVERSAGLAVETVLAAHGAKRFVAARERAYNGVEDYLLFDAESGRLAHVHLHYELVLGERHLKGFRLPWEELALSTRVIDDATGVAIADPHLELLLLLLRFALKVRRRDALQAGARGLPRAAEDELRWLVARVDRARLRALAGELVGDRAGTLVIAMLDGVPTRRQLLALRAAARPVLDACRTVPPLSADWQRWRREWLARAGKLRRRLGGETRALKLTRPQGGTIVALLGADGSGKSTVARELTAWLGWKAEVAPLYFGFGDGTVSLVRRPLRAVKRLIVHWRRRAGRRPGASDGAVALPPASREGPARTAWLLLWAWSIVREKKQRLRRARRVRSQGGIVVCDRFPQAQLMELSDGPLLARQLTHHSRLVRRIARWELAAYRGMAAQSPDLAIKLHASPHVAAARKPAQPLGPLAARADAVRQVAFGRGVRVIELDADAPLDAVLLAAKRAVWAAL